MEKVWTLIYYFRYSGFEWIVFYNYVNSFILQDRPETPPRPLPRKTTVKKPNHVNEDETIGRPEVESNFVVVHLEPPRNTSAEDDIYEVCYCFWNCGELWNYLAIFLKKNFILFNRSFLWIFLLFTTDNFFEDSCNRPVSESSESSGKQYCVI